MRKQSMMGSSKYEFNPEQLQIDYESNKKRHKEKLEYVADELDKLLKHDAIRLEETWEMVIQILREKRMS